MWHDLQVELYSGVFNHIPDTCKLVSGQHAGLTLIADKQMVQVLTGSGEQISQWKWNNSPQVPSLLVGCPCLYTNYSRS